MTRFNSKSAPIKVLNKAGGQAYQESSKLELVSILLTSFLKNDFYRSADETVSRLRELITNEKDKKFVAQAAVYARTQFGMRSVSHLVAAEIAKQVKGAEWSKEFFNKIVYRPDDMSEIMACYCHENGKPIPNAMKKGFAKALERSTAYALAKYRMDKKDVSLVDIVNLVHPKHTDAIKLLVGGELKNKDTWEKVLSEAGHGDEDGLEDRKDKAWKDLLLENKLGFFALLRNLRNIVQQSPESIPLACKALVNEEAIKKSLVLPFRFVTAIKVLSEINEDGCQQVIRALNKAVDIALSNVPKFDGKTLVVLDTSGSMEGQPIEIGSLFSAILIKANNADFMRFSDDAEYLTLNPDDSTLTLSNQIRRARMGGTNFNAIFQVANKKYDRIIILSDMQGWVQDHTMKRSFIEFKQRLGCSPFLYSFDLAGLGTLQFPEDKVFCLAGFSDKTMDIMSMLEKDKNALIHEIEKIVL